MLTIICSECGNKLTIPEEFLGQWGTCKHCGKRIQANVSPLKFSQQIDEIESSANPPKNQELFAKSEAIDLNDNYFDESDRVDTPKPINVSAVKPNIAEAVSQLGKGLISCGCLLLISPILLLIFVISFQLIFGSSDNESKKSDTRTTSTNQIQRPVSTTNNSSLSTTPPPPLLEYQQLKIGEYYQFSGDFNLMPELNPVDPIAATKHVIKIHGQNCWVLINEKQNKNSTPWYGVSVYELQGVPIANGWINSDALIGYTIISSKSATTGHSTQPRPSATQTTVFITPTGKMYHYRNCSTLSRSTNLIEILLEEARRTHTPCGICKPPR